MAYYAHPTKMFDNVGVVAGMKCMLIAKHDIP
jgi:hypothetical protein